MRRFVQFVCEDAPCVGTIDPGVSAVGILIVSGGSEPRSGAHAWQSQLASLLAREGHPVLRFDRRGVGDSAGDDLGFRASGAELISAVACLRREQPQVRQIVGIGNCDAATALALFGRESGLSALLLLNPWLVEPRSDLPPVAAIRHRYRTRIFSASAWIRLLTGRTDLVKAARGLRETLLPSATDLAVSVADALAKGGLPATVVLASGDATALACASAWKDRAFDRVRTRIATRKLPTDSHSFAGEGDLNALAATCRSEIATLLSADD